MLSQAEKVEIGAIVQNGAASGDTDRASQVAHQVEQTGGQLQTLRSESTERECHGRSHSELLRKATEGLREQQLLPAPIVRDGREFPHSDREAGQAGHQQPAQVDPLCAEGVKRNRQQLKDTRREHRPTDFLGAETAYSPQKDRRQIDRGKDPRTGDEGEETTEREVTALECPEVHDWVAERETAP